MPANVRRSFAAACAVICLSFVTLTAEGQSCYTKTTTGGGSTVNVVAGVPTIGTLAANTNARENDAADSSYYQVSTFYGPTTLIFGTALVSSAAADNDHAPFGLTFINGTALPVTVTQADITASKAIFRSAPGPDLIQPTGCAAPDNCGTWTFSTASVLHWAGSIVIGPKSARTFIVDAKIVNSPPPKPDILNVLVGGTFTTSAGNFTTAAFPTDIYVPNGPEKVATAVVGFVDPFNAGAGNGFPRTFNNAFDNRPPAGATKNLVGGLPSIITVRVQEYANNQDIAAGLALRVDIPAGFSSVSVASAGAPWSTTPANLTIVQPTATTAGSVTIKTTAIIGKKSDSGDVQIQLTPPVVQTKSVFQMKASLAGFDTAGGPSGPHVIRSVCDGGGTILPNGPGSLNVEFLSPRLNFGPNSAPVGAVVDFQTDFNLINNAGGELLTVEAFNFTTNSWTTLAPTPVAPGSTDYTLTASLGGDYLDGNSAMKVRYVGPSNPMTLRVDFLRWTVGLFWMVDNATGSDLNAGSFRFPFATLAKAASVVGNSEQVQVRVGNSQTSTPYAGNLAITTAGTAACKTLFQGVASSGLLPKLSGGGLEAGANHIQIDSFQIDNATLNPCDPNIKPIALCSGSVTGTVFSNNTIRLPDVSYGIAIATSTSATALNNTISVLAGTPLFGILDAATNSSLIDGNRVTGLPNGEAIRLEGSTNATVQRNILTANFFGMHLARTAGTTNVYNNTVDSNTRLGIFAELTGSIVARNNIVTRNPQNWVSNAPGAVSSNFDDVFGAAIPAQNYVGVTPGINSISANPNLDVNSKPNPGSPCINAGTNVGLPFVGAAPDIGASEQ